MLWHRETFLSAEIVEGTSEQGVGEPDVEQEKWLEETGTRHKAWPATSGRTGTCQR